MTDENINNTEAAIQAGEQLAAIADRVMLLEHPESATTKIPVVLMRGSDGEISVEVLERAIGMLDQRLPAPRAREGVQVLTELASLIEYANRYKTPSAIAWADTKACRIGVVFDEHPAGPDVAAWRRFRATYTCPRSAEWMAWCQFDGQPMKQEQFADFIEARLEDLRAADGMPKPLDVLTVARNLVMRTRGTFERSVDPTTGANVLVNKVENEPAGSTTIPRAFAIGVPVFEGGDLYQVEVRIRVAVTEGRATFSYVMHRRPEIERAAFADIRKAVADGTGLPVLAGTV